MICQLLTLYCLLMVSTVAVTATDEVLPSNQAIPLLLWAVSDPAEDKEASKIDSVKFYNFYEDNLKLFGDYDARVDVVGVTRFLIEHADESGAKGINWPAVLAKIVLKKTMGQTEESEHGLPSLVLWAMRNTGTESGNPSISRRALVESILSHRTDILKLLYQGDVDGLIDYLNQIKSESGAESLDWKSIIENLRDNRQLFKYSCGPPESSIV